MFWSVLSTGLSQSLACCISAFEASILYFCAKRPRLFSKNCFSASWKLILSVSVWALARFVLQQKNTINKNSRVFILNMVLFQFNGTKIHNGYEFSMKSGKRFFRLQVLKRSCALFRKHRSGLEQVNN